MAAADAADRRQVLPAGVPAQRHHDDAPSSWKSALRPHDPHDDGGVLAGLYVREPDLDPVAGRDRRVQVAGIDQFAAVVLLGGFALLYHQLYGGLKAVALTDIVQVSLLVLGGLLIVGPDPLKPDGRRRRHRGGFPSFDGGAA